ncbi:glycine/D-amino acid oxidase, deaminating [Frankia sp. CeD]|uniref:FAD dependent oxidoreductase n=1 Tax=Frankia casuarinae (strain DSM 45818 / CECT 9043 / HFP020203 / CcI3) TaxID=106370 RepID=Q2J7W1_FRACC|nr:FAD dependent oxidoreductase [Frankia casuarinae]KEZ36982.1 glycine/D-amino acid oxidase, deaminating [Frankia sp. CeD]
MGQRACDYGEAARPEAFLSGKILGQRACDHVDADVVVVGAGVVGCLVATEALARAPHRRVTVIDRGVVGGGVSRFSAGLHFPRGATPRVRALAAYSHRWYEDLRRRDPQVPIHPVGLTVVSTDEAAVREHYLPEARLRPADQGWEGDGAHYADVGALTQLLAARLRDRAAFREGTAVTAVGSAPDGVVLTLSTGARLTAGRVVLAPGPWLAWPELLAPLGVRIKKVVALHIERPATPRDRTTVFHDEDAFLLPLAHRGHWLFSYTSPDWDVTPDALTGELSADDLDRGRAILDRYAPKLSPYCVSGRVFCDAYSPDRTPIVRPVTADGRVLFAGAAGGSGYRLAPAIAAAAADLLDEKDTA